MLIKSDYEKHKGLAIKYLENAGIAITDEEKNCVEVAEYGQMHFMQK